MSTAVVYDAVVTQTGAAQLVAPPPVTSRRAVLDARVVKSGNQTVTPPVLGDDT